MAQKGINNKQAATTLSGGIDDTTTSLTSTDNATTAGFPAVPFVALIETELILVTSIGSGTNWTVQRGYGSSTAAAHSSTDPIAFAVIDEDWAFRYDTASNDYKAQADIDLNGNSVIGWSSELITTYVESGTLTTFAGTFRMYATENRTLVSVQAQVTTPPSGGSCTFDVNVDGASIWPTAGKPTITTGNNYSSLVAAESTTWNSGSYVTVDIDSVTAPAADAVVVIKWVYA